MKKSGAEIADNGALTFALWTCDTLFFLDAAMDRANELSARGLADAVGRLGTSFKPAATFATRFSAGRRDGATMVRKLAYNTACECFRWNGEAYGIE